MGVAPSVVSRSVTSIELTLGVQLFERGRNGIRPTAAGEIFARHAQERWRLDERLIEDLSAVQGGERGVVHFAIGEGFIATTFRRIASDFLRSHPNVLLHAETAGTDSMVERVTSGELDFGLAFSPRLDPALESLAEVDTPVCAILHPKHPLAGKSPLPLSALSDVPCGVQLPRYGTRSALEQAEWLGGFRLRKQVETNSISLLLEFVREGFGATFLPRFAMPGGSEDLTAVPLTDAPLSGARSVLMKKRGRELGPAASLFAGHLRQMMASLAD